MGRNNNQQTSNNSMEPSARPSCGLFLSGTVTDRTRRRVPRDNPTTEIVTYTLCDDNEKKYFVDDYAPDHYYNLGAYVSLPVYVKPYQKKNNDISYNLCVQKQSSSRGER
ncbi:MAG: hypothetical protein K6E53_00470, partial [Lachnospiraceae bacterium]|nr:hypothetical protein [Lachnospiraceae bacterium]